MCGLKLSAFCKNIDYMTVSSLDHYNGVNKVHIV